TPRLQVPHYHMHARSFVLYPLAELAADLILPDGTPLQQLLLGRPPTGLERLTDAAGRDCWMYSQADYAVRAATGPPSRDGSRDTGLPIIAMLPAEGRITGICHA